MKGESNTPCPSTLEVTSWVEKLLQRHYMTKTQNKIPAKISDFTVFDSSMSRDIYAPNKELLQKNHLICFYYT
jgi:hypothetical protein